MRLFLFISAKTGQRVEKLYELIHYVGEQNAMRIPHRAAQRYAILCYSEGAAAVRQRETAADLLYDPGFDQAADLCGFCQFQRAVPFFPISGI